MDFDIHEPIRHHIPKIVLEYDFFRDDADGHSHIFKILEGCAVVKIFDVDGAKSGAVGGYHAVQQQFYSGEGSAGGGGVPRILEAIASNGEAHTMDFGLEGTDGGDETAVCNFFVGRDFGPGDEEDCVVAARHAGANTLGEAFDVVCESGDPGVCIGSSGEVAVLKAVASEGVDDSVSGGGGDIVGRVHWGSKWRRGRALQKSGEGKDVTGPEIVSVGGIFVVVRDEVRTGAAILERRRWMMVGARWRDVVGKNCGGHCLWAWDGYTVRPWWRQS